MVHFYEIFGYMDLSTTGRAINEGMDHSNSSKAPSILTR